MDSLRTLGMDIITVRSLVGNDIETSTKDAMMASVLLDIPIKLWHNNKYRLVHRTKIVSEGEMSVEEFNNKPPY